MKRTILALALLVALVLPGMAKAEGTGGGAEPSAMTRGV